MKKSTLFVAVFLLTASRLLALSDSAAFTVSATSICERQYITVTNTSTSLNPSHTSYEWNFGYSSSPYNSYLTNPTGFITYGSAGSPTIQLIQRDSTSGTVSITYRVITVLPVPYFTGTSILPTDGVLSCLHDSVVMTAGTSFPSTLAWTRPGGVHDTGASIIARTAGTYTLVAVSGAGCASYPATWTVTQAPVPTVSVQLYADGGFSSTADSLRICASTHPGLNLSVTGAISSVLWNTGSTMWSLPADSTRKYAVTVTDMYGCTAKDSMYVKILASPSAALTVYPLTPPCVGDTIIASLPRVPGYHYLWSDMSTNDTIMFTTWAGYDATVTDSNGCTAHTGWHSAGFNPLPSPMTVSAACSLTVATIDPGARYQWYQYMTPVSGATSALYVVPITNFYKVMETDSNGCVNFSPIVSVTACPTFDSCTVHPQPVPSVITGLACAVGASVTADTFQWYRNSVPIPGSDTQYLAISLPGYYSVRATNHWGCTSVSSAVLDSCGGPTPISDTCTLHPQATPTVLTGVHCVVGSSESADTFLWYRNGLPIASSDTQFLPITLPGFYSVKCTNRWGCSMTSAVVVDSCPSTIITPPADTCTTHPQATPTVLTGINCRVGSSVTAASYLWYENGSAIPASNMQYLAISSSGFYSVKATNVWGCSATSESVMANCDVTGVASVQNDAALKVYPNPTTDAVTIELAGTFTASIRSITGQLMARADGNASLNVSLKDFPSGMYSVEIRNDKQVFNATIIKQ